MVISNKDYIEYKLMRGEIEWLNGGKSLIFKRREGRKKINKRQIEKKWEYGTLNPNISSNSKHK